MKDISLMIKRCIDFMGSGFGLVIVSPLLLITAVAIKIFMPGPVFFRQQRIGKNGRAFDILKFRSMRVDIRAESEHDFTKDKERLTSLGLLIRRLKIDELPQLITSMFISISAFIYRL